MLIYIILIFIFLMLSAFFSGMEAAIFSISRFRVKTLLFENKKGSKALEKIKKESGKTLASILLGNLLVNIGASSVATIILIQIIATYGFDSTLSFIIEFIIMTSLLLIVGEITPKTVAISNAEFFALKFSGSINYLTKIFSPISILMELFTRRLVT
jgi:putative hemolysin